MQINRSKFLEKNASIPINGEKQALATPTVNIILSLVRIKLGFLIFSDNT